MVEFKWNNFSAMKQWNSGRVRESVKRRQLWGHHNLELLGFVYNMLTLQIIIRCVPLGRHAVQVSCFYLLNSHMTVRSGDSHHSGLWVAGYLVTSRQIQAQLPHLGEGMWLNPGQPLRSDWPLGKGPGPGVFHVHPCTFLFHTRKGSEGQSWDNFLFISDLVLHVGQPNSSLRVSDSGIPEAMPWNVISGCSGGR